MFGLPEILGAAAGSGLASLLSPKQEDPAHAISKNVQKNQGDYYYTPNFVNQMNTLLNNALQQAIDTSTGYTQTAVNTLQGSQAGATQSLEQYLQNALSQSQGLANKGLSQYQALQQPYAKAGYDANDAYMQSLGLNTPQGGTYAQLQAQQLAPLLKSLQGNYSEPVAPNSPNYITADKTVDQFAENLSPDQIKNAALGYLNNTYTVTDSYGRKPYTYGPGSGHYASTVSGLGSMGITPDQIKNAGLFIEKNGSVYGGAEQWNNLSGLQDKAKNDLANSSYQSYLQNISKQNEDLKQQYNQSYNTYQNNLNNYSSVSSFLNSLSPQQQQAIAANLKGLLG